MIDMNGKSAVITGGGHGLGLSYAKLMASQGAGVVINDLGGDWSGLGADSRAATQACEEILGEGGNATPNFGDVTLEDDARAMIELALSTYGSLDVLVCNAGILRDSMVFNMAPEDWDSVVNVHMRGHYLPVHFAARHWREKFKTTGESVNASVILTTSRSGLYANVGQLNYAAAKAGIATMAIVLARELAKYGVRVNAIAPIARTRMTEGSFGEISSNRWVPENVAPFVSFLASDESEGISGQVFVVGGGKIEWMQNWSPQSEIESSEELFTPEYIAANREKLFGVGPTGPGSYPTATWS
jgi:3-oxoacyl-[acyl-carrier protein] reductase